MGKKHVMDLPVRLTPSERERRGIELAGVLQAKSDHEGHQAAIKTTWKKEITEFDADISRLRRIVARGEEIRPVECTEERNWQNKTVELFRVDTGELVNFRPMSEHELQRELDFDGEAN